MSEYVAVFVDVLGVASAFANVPDNVETAVAARGRSSELHNVPDVWVYALTAFHRIIGRVFGERTNTRDSPSFVAEFSDSAFAIYSNARAALRVSLRLMSEALVDEDGIPLRVGVGRGFFVHRGTTFSVDHGLAWSACQFFGSSIVRAYQAERSPAKGIRAFVHPSVVQVLKSTNRDLLLSQLPAHEASASASHEVRFLDGNGNVIAANVWRMRQTFDPSNRAPRHYDDTLGALERMTAESREMARHHTTQKGNSRPDGRPTNRFSGRASRAAER